MVLSDFLSRQKTDDSNPHELIPISFSLRDKVSDYFYHIDNESNLPRKDKYLVQTRSQVRSSGIRLPEIHGVNKGINPHLKPERQRPLPTLPTQNIPPTRTDNLLTKDHLHIPFQSPELVKVELD